ncbi:winged helix-turn-helix transcriptional regulator [Chlorobium limicola]|nr:winged helix-turn-helix transcriptional regulator [Chlorobium limicola]
MKIGYISAFEAINTTIEINDTNPMDTKAAILDVLQKEGKPMSAGQIADASGIDRKEVDKAMKALKEEERIVSPKRCYWEPKQ